LTFNVSSQLFFGSFNLIFHGVSVDILPLGCKEIVKGSICDFNLLPQFLDNIDVLVDVFKGLLGAFNSIRETEHFRIILIFFKIIFIFLNLSSGLFYGLKSSFNTSCILVVVFGSKTFLVCFLIFFESIDNFLSLFSLDVDEWSDLFLDSQTNLVKTLLIFFEFLSSFDFFSFRLVHFFKVSECLLNHI
jgi:hypothetical protein